MKMKFKSSKKSFELDLDIVNAINNIFKFCFIGTVTFVLSLNVNYSSEIQNQNIKKESLQYEFCLATETYCMIQNDNR